MPSIRRPLSIDDKIIALYSDPIPYAIADHIARHCLGAQPGTEAYRRHVTCFMLDLEARLHGNRQKAKASAEKTTSFAVRRELALRTTGSDVMLSKAPSEPSVRQWRYRFLPSPIANDETLRDASLIEQLEAVAERHKAEGLPENLTSTVALFEQLTMEFAREIGQFPTDFEDGRNLARLRREHLVVADGTYVSPYSGVSWYRDEEDDLRWHGTRAKTAEPKVQAFVQQSGKEHGPAAGVNHVAVLTRTAYGRVVLSIQRALGGEIHGALEAMDRIAPLAEGGIRALVYDKALDGWSTDYLFAHHAILSIVEPKAASKKKPGKEEASAKVEAVLQERRHAAGLDDDACRPTANEPGEIGARAKKAKHQTVLVKVKDAMVRRVLGRMHNVDRLIEDAEAGSPLGAELPLGTSVYLDSHNEVVPVASQHLPFEPKRHLVAGEDCVHDLHVDDGALWDTRVQWDPKRHGVQEVVKDQRLECERLEAVMDPRTGWYRQESLYRFTCEYTGEVLTRKIGHNPSGEWRPKKSRKRTARHHMQPLARCDYGWREIYGRRNDTESWFSWLKNQLLEDQRAASLDLNHQYLDVLYAAIITNSITRFHHVLEAHLADR